MKKRYVISIITVFIILLSFFAYNKLSNKEISEYNNTIGIYLEDDYESNTYTLSDSSDIPSDDYIFNETKTNEECPNATFSYESESNKVHVNSNKSVECNMYFKADVPQLVHYTMLYDGSLGDAEENQMKDYTGGYSTCIAKYNSSASASLYSNRINTTSSAIYAGGAAISNRKIEFNKYSELWTKVNGSHTSNYGVFSVSSNPTPCSSTNDTDMRSSYAPYIAFGPNKSANGFYHTVINPSVADNYIEVYCDSAGCSANWYYIFLTKSDNYTELASKINVTVSSIDNLLNNYSIQLLNNEKSVKFMLKQCTGDFMAHAVTNSTFMSAYQSSPYKTMIDANLHWKKFIDMVS